MKMGGKDTKCRIPFLKSPHVLIQQPGGKCPVLSCSGAGIFVADLNDDLMKRLLLFSRTDLLIIILNLPV
jgi:hypothetical protein